MLLLLLLGCGVAPPEPDAGVIEPEPDAGPTRPDDPWGDRVVRYAPGPGAGFGQDRFPEVVLGAPEGGGTSQGSLDVLSLGNRGVIEIEFIDLAAIDGPGVDVLVFENGFPGFLETGAVEVSDDGIDWRAFPCGAGTDAGISGCAGAHPVFANPAQGISGTDPSVAGGDGFDLADVGLARARFVRITDSGANRFYGPPAGGFDLDAVSVVNTVKLSP